MGEVESEVESMEKRDASRVRYKAGRAWRLMNRIASYVSKDRRGEMASAVRVS